MKFTREGILEHYKTEAAKHGTEGTSTIQDPRTRELEIAALMAHIKDGMKVLEAGCGNGYTARRMAESFQVRIDAFDLTPEMVRLAQAQDLSGTRGKVRYIEGDLLTFFSKPVYDLVFTERAVQNLPTWEDQKKAFANLCAAVKPGGRLVLLESFESGWRNLNQARQELGLPEIPMYWHNLFFEDRATRGYLESLGMTLVAEDRFLSGYYFGSRLLYPALLPDPAKARFASPLNDYFMHLPPYGDYSPLKIWVLEKPRAGRSSAKLMIKRKRS